MKDYCLIAALFFLGFNGNSQAFFSREQVIADIDFYNNSLQEIHYDPFLFVKKDDYFAEVEKIKSNLGDSVAVQDLILSLYRLTAMMEDSHSSPAFQQPALQEEEKKKQFFPYRTLLENDKLFVPVETALALGIPPGSEITAINGVAIRPLLVSLQDHIGGLPHYKKEVASRLLFRYLYLSGIKAPFVIDYMEPTGGRDQKRVEEGISNVQGLLVAYPGFAEGNSFSIIDDSLGYIKFSNMTGPVEEWIQLLKAAFVEFREKNIQHLAIDIRDNAGGDSLLAEVLFGFITPKEYQLMGYKNWKISRQYKEQLIANGRTGEEYLQQETGSIWEIGDCEPAVSRMPVEDKFKGQVYVLTGAFTFSSANMLADAAKEYKLAQLVGEPTGETTNDFGELYSFALPNTGIVMNLTTSKNIGAGCDPIAREAVIPDVHITPTLEDKIQDRDKVLEYVLQEAKGK